MQPRTERKGPASTAGDVEHIGALVDRGVAIGCGHHGDDDFARRHTHIAKVFVDGRHPRDCTVDGTLVAQKFLGGVVGQFAVDEYLAPRALPLLGVFGERDEAAGDRITRGLEASGHEQYECRGDLVRCEPVTGERERSQRAEHVVARFFGALVQQPEEVVGRAIGRGVRVGEDALRLGSGQHWLVRRRQHLDPTEAAVAVGLGNAEQLAGDKHG